MAEEAEAEAEVVVEEVSRRGADHRSPIRPEPTVSIGYCTREIRRLSISRDLAGGAAKVEAASEQRLTGVIDRWHRRSGWHRDSITITATITFIGSFRRGRRN